MSASGSSGSTSGLRPVCPSILSHTASFTLSAVKRVLRSSSFAPCVCTAMLAPQARTSSHGRPRTPSCKRSASDASTRPTTASTREASRDHRHADSAPRTSQNAATPPASGRTRLTPMRLSSSASGASKPARQLANSSMSSFSMAQVQSSDSAGWRQQVSEKPPRADNRPVSRLSNKPAVCSIPHHAPARARPARVPGRAT